MKNGINYYESIKELLIKDEIYSEVKDNSKERHRVETYFKTGKLLSEAGKEYGKDIIGNYADKLMVEVKKKFNKSTLFKIRKFYKVFSNEKVAPLVPQLSWSHCLLLIPKKNINEINYYINQVYINNLSKRDLEIIIRNKQYERLPDETKNKLISKEDISLIDSIKNPIIIKSNNEELDNIKEFTLKNLILEDIPGFMKELGTGFSFIDSEYKIKLDNKYNYIDLLLYNIKYRCYAVIELKVTELKKEHTGQIMTYMNYIDKNIKKFDENNTVGIIICKKNNKYIIEYCSDERIISREYELI